MSHVTRHTSHVTCHTSHVTRHTSRQLPKGGHMTVCWCVHAVGGAAITACSTALLQLGVSARLHHGRLGFGVWGLGFGVWGLGFALAW